MDSRVGNNRDYKKKSIRRETFAAVTVLAVILAVVLVTLGRSTQAALTATAACAAASSPPRADTLGVTMGSAGAPIAITEYSDFQCGYCQQFALTLEGKLQAAYIDTGKVRLTYKFMIAWGQESERADEAAASAAEQNQFWPFYYLLMQQRASPAINDLPVEKLQGLARQLGLNMDTFNAGFLSHKFADWVKGDDTEARALGVTGTPAFFINGVKLNGATSLADFQKIIEPMLVKAVK